MRNKVQLQQTELAKNDERKRVIFRLWKEWAQAGCERRVKLKLYDSKFNHKLMSDAFKEWKVAHQQVVSARQHTDSKLSSLAFNTWFDAVHKQVNEKHKISKLQQEASVQLLMRSFLLWRRMHDSRLKAEENTKQKAASILNNSFTIWKRTTQEHKADRNYNRNVYKHAFAAWKEMYVTKNKVKFVMKVTVRKWKTLVEGERFRRSLLERYISDRNRLLLLSALASWLNRQQHVQATKVIERRHQMVRDIAIHWKLKTKARIFRSNIDENLKEKYFMTWSLQYTLRRKAVATHEWNTKRRSLHSWLRASFRLKEMDEKIEMFTKHRNQELIRLLFVRWKTKVSNIEMNKRAEEQLKTAVGHHQLHLKKALFERWEIFVRISKIKKMRELRLARKYYLIWWNNVLAGQTVLNFIRHNMSEKYWRKWRSAYIKRHVMKLMEKRERKKMVSVVFTSWRHHTQLNRTLPREMDIAITGIWFRKWRDRYNRRNITAS